MRRRDFWVGRVVNTPKDRRYLGTISDRDIVTRCVAAAHDPKECSAEDHVRTDTAVVTPDPQLERRRVLRGAGEGKQIPTTDRGRGRQQGGAGCDRDAE